MLSSRARYATRAVLDLSLRDSERSVPIQDIADRQGIPLKYLQQILAGLKVAGLLVSRKGPGGGYSLARDSADITLGEVIRAMDGELLQVPCLNESRYSECGCDNPDACAFREAYGTAQAALAHAMNETSFADLRDRQRLLSGDAGAISFVI